MTTPAHLNKPALYRPSLYKHFHRIAWLAVALAMCVIVFGAFVRLSNAGLSCPDWPTCYGKAAWPTHADQVGDILKAADVTLDAETLTKINAVSKEIMYPMG